MKKHNLTTYDLYIYGLLDEYEISFMYFEEFKPISIKKVIMEDFYDEWCNQLQPKKHLMTALIRWFNIDENNRMTICLRRKDGDFMYED